MEQGIATSIKGNKAIVRTELEVHTEFCPEEIERLGDIVLLEVDNSIGARDWLCPIAQPIKSPLDKRMLSGLTQM